MTTTAATALPAALAALLGADGVSADPAARAAHAVHGAQPDLIVTPGSPADLAAALRLLREHGAAVVPWGGGTKQWIGGPVDRRSSVVILKTTRLDQILEHEPADLTISVGAGMTLGALRAHLARHGQMLPLDPALPERATIGGLIAAAADGPRRLGYGTLRDLLIGIGVADTAGRLTKGGGMVVKNVSGFDMMKLYLGSFGTLAVIVSANFKLLPAPRTGATLRCTLPNRAAALALLDDLHATQLTPAAVEYVHNAEVLGETLHHTVLVRAEGLEAAVERHLADVPPLARRHGASVATITDDAALWAAVADFPQAAAFDPDEALVKLTLLPSELGQVLAAIELTAPEAAICARALSGVLYVRLRTSSAAQIAALAAASAAVQWTATPIAGAVRWGTPPGLDLMRRIKREFDPTNTLNPGRFIAGVA